MAYVDWALILFLVLMIGSVLREARDVFCLVPSPWVIFLVSGVPFLYTQECFFGASYFLIHTLFFLINLINKKNPTFFSRDPGCTLYDDLFTTIKNFSRNSMLQIERISCQLFYKLKNHTYMSQVGFSYHTTVFLLYVDTARKKT